MTHFRIRRQLRSPGAGGSQSNSGPPGGSAWHMRAYSKQNRPLRGSQPRSPQTMSALISMRISTPAGAPTSDEAWTLVSMLVSMMVSMLVSVMVAMLASLLRYQPLGRDSAAHRESSTHAPTP
ncbi:unnamed protein product [Prorocentrum cordatum]|uniref:Uncharacterized protein n=1 Tax=Prorocentrum cordatum TaxID=2364126 RepID=A0ABN9RH04_9DINO|nr:unnamed protein product [Polarella glacialis]